MSDDSGKGSLVMKFWRMSLLIFGGVVLLVLAVELIKTIWWILALAAVISVGVGALIRWWRYGSLW